MEKLAGAWWNVPPEDMFRAYYMTLRIHHGMTALDAYTYAREHGPSLGVGREGGIIGLLKEALSS